MVEEKKDTTIEEEAETFSGKVFEAVLGAQMAQTAYLGAKLGWYDALAAAGKEGLTAPALAEQTKSSARYAREWLEQQAVGGWIQCADDSAKPDERRFFLTKGQAIVLTDRDSLFYTLPLPTVQAAFGICLPQLVEAYKNDTGVSWDQIGNDAREQQAAMNRPFCLQILPEVVEKAIGIDTASKLKDQGGRIVDIGVGFGFSTVGLAKRFVKAQIDAYDIDEPSVLAAREIVATEGLGARVNIHCCDAKEGRGGVPADVVVALECIHDMGDPISVLRTMRELAGDSGTVLVIDEKVQDEFSSQPDPCEQAFYGFSCMCCLADGKSHPNSTETGTVMRPKLLRAYAQQAGFRDIDIVPMDHDFFRCYRLFSSGAP